MRPTAVHSRDDLLEVYLWIVDQSIISERLISAAEVAGYTDKHPSTIRSICQRLADEKLVDEVHGVWSTKSAVVKDDPNETLASAEEAFDSVFPPTAPKRWTPERRREETGYSDKQIVAGLQARREGKSWRKAAEAAGLGPASSYYFSTVLRRIDPAI